ncbi:unnamed protein product [Adineta steineri]|uniref:G-protein coupled receptors family 1 profile domain-containing protein n=1 Tax=Adineta steineri TaxID=433720 RepID=A0A814SVS7_9BILA|nr:unnamed protein product [Adineta steineri]CAF3922775.1 unnamed protein product [Adineta steineri]CAF4126672.1 unnamed protein product [Adineta steineri]
MNDTSMEVVEVKQDIIRHVKFGILLILEIPSVLLTLMILIFFIAHRAVLRVRQNQGLFLLIIVNFIQVTFDLPMVIDFNRIGRVNPATPAYCSWWTFIEYTLNGAGEMLMATISIQRHVIVFQAHVFNNRWYRYLFHHIPLLFCIVYPVTLYLIIIIFAPCDGTQWDYTSNVCGLANCYMVYNPPLATYDWGVDNGLPIVVITIANVALLVRVIRQKLRRQGTVSWKKQRRMTVQLLSISLLYFIAWLPGIVVAVIQQLFIPGFLAEIQVEYIFYLTYMICLFVPWVCLGLFPEFIKWIWSDVLHRTTPSNVIKPRK